MSNTLRKTVYLRAAELVDGGWTQDVYARNAHGAVVSPFAKTAVKFCAVGALQRALFEIIGDRNEAEAFALRASAAHKLVELNEDKKTTQAAVRTALLDLANGS